MDEYKTITIWNPTADQWQTMTDGEKNLYFTTIGSMKEILNWLRQSVNERI